MNKIQQVGVIGAGVMGCGVAQVIAQNGMSVILVDIDEQKLAAAKDTIFNNLRIQTLLNRNQANISPEEIIKKIHPTTDYKQLNRVDYVIENVTEDWDIKCKVYDQLDAICLKHCIFAVNTSAIPITRLSERTKRPSQVLGIHFMNPVPLKNTVEVIRGKHTSPQTIATSEDLLQRIQKQAVIVNDSPGFVSNRVLMLTINEAILLVQEGVAQAKDIDKVFRNCFEHKMGPLATADMIGLDTILKSIEVLYDNFNNAKYLPCSLLKEMVAAGHLGAKSGKGFYEYQEVSNGR